MISTRSINKNNARTFVLALFLCSNTDFISYRIDINLILVLRLK